MKWFIYLFESINIDGCVHKFWWMDCDKLCVEIVKLCVGIVKLYHECGCKRVNVHNYIIIFVLNFKVH